MSGALAGSGSGFVGSLTGSVDFTSAGGDDCFDLDCPLFREDSDPPHLAKHTVSRWARLSNLAVGLPESALTLSPAVFHELFLGPCLNTSITHQNVSKPGFFV